MSLVSIDFVAGSDIAGVMADDGHMFLVEQLKIDGGYTKKYE
jgi:hypothetical protein